MLVFKDGSGVQSFPEASDQAHIVINDSGVIGRIEAGERFTVSGENVVFESIGAREQRETDEAKAGAEPEIDQTAQAVRLCYVSPGKDATYQQKAAELDRYELESGASGPYPYIDAEAVARGVAVAVVVGEISYARSVWGAIDPQIEAVSRAGKVSAQAAVTAAGVAGIITDTLGKLEALKP